MANDGKHYGMLTDQIEEAGALPVVVEDLGPTQTPAQMRGILIEARGSRNTITEKLVAEARNIGFHIEWAKSK
jgi:hypothetical protein